MSAPARAADAAPLQVRWVGLVLGPSGDTEGERTVVPLATPGAPDSGPDVALVLDTGQREMLGALLAPPEPDEATCVGCGCTETTPCPGGCYWVTSVAGVDLCSVCAAGCRTPGCGATQDLDPSDPTLIGWIRVQVAGAGSDPVWVCSAACAAAAITAAGRQIAEQDGPGETEPEPPAAATVELDGGTVIRLDGWDMGPVDTGTPGAAGMALGGWASGEALPGDGVRQLVRATVPGGTPETLTDLQVRVQVTEYGPGAPWIRLRWRAGYQGYASSVARAGGDAQ